MDLYWFAFATIPCAIVAHFVVGKITSAILKNEKILVILDENGKEEEILVPGETAGLDLYRRASEAIAFEKFVEGIVRSDMYEIGKERFSISKPRMGPDIVIRGERNIGIEIKNSLISTHKNIENLDRIINDFDPFILVVKDKPRAKDLLRIKHLLGRKNFFLVNEGHDVDTMRRLKALLSELGRNTEDGAILQSFRVHD